MQSWWLIQSSPKYSTKRYDSQLLDGSSMHGSMQQERGKEETTNFMTVYIAWCSLHAQLLLLPLPLALQPLLISASCKVADHGPPL